MKKPAHERPLHLHPRDTAVVPLTLSTDVVASVAQVAVQRDMSSEALLKLYIGQGLRQDLARLFGERVLETTAHVLPRRLRSEETVAAIMREIREASVQ